MKPTDEDVEATAATAVDAMNGKHGLAEKWPERFTEEQRQNLLDFLQYALEAYTPRLIERLAKEAEAGNWTAIDDTDPVNGDVNEMPLSDLIRSHIGDEHD